MKPVILLDCDGPLADFTGAYLDAVHRETGCIIKAYEIDQWHIHQCAAFKAAAAAANMSPKDLKSRVVQQICKPGFCEDLRPHAKALEAVEQLQSIGEVFVVTSPWASSPTWMYERMHWVAEHFHIPREHVIQTGRKHLIRGDVFVDDKLEHIVEWSAAWPTATAILFDMHHNRGESAKTWRGGWSHAIEAAQKNLPK